MRVVRTPVALGTVAVLILGALSAALGVTESASVPRALGGPVVLAVRAAPAPDGSAPATLARIEPVAEVVGLAVPAPAETAPAPTAAGSGTRAAPTTSSAPSAATTPPAASSSGEALAAETLAAETATPTWSGHDAQVPSGSSQTSGTQRGGGHGSTWGGRSSFDQQSAGRQSSGRQSSDQQQRYSGSRQSRGH